jgi:cation-transporting P-type ATPase 13A2
MSSPRTSRAWDITNTAGPSNYKVYPSSRSRRSSSSIRHRSRNESSASLLLYDPDTYTDDLIPQDVIFDGPSASSVPTSVSNFAHRGSRASLADDDRAVALRFFAAEFDSDAEDVLTEVDPEEEERRSSLSSSRVSEVSSVAVLSTPDIERGGDQFPLIRRKSSDQRSEGSFSGRARSTQKIYLSDEDMVVVMSGFRTRIGRLWIYRVLCILTFGMIYLLLRWLPRWRLRLIAEPLPLSEAHWVVVEVRSFQFVY